MIYHPEKSVILSEIPESTKCHAPVWIGKNVVIGERCKIQAMCFIPDGVTLENDVFLGPSVTMTNDKKPPSGKWTPTRVCQFASIGANATILPGITIGSHSMVGAGSVVTKDVAPYTVVAGNPAKFLRALWCPPKEHDFDNMNEMNCLKCGLHIAQLSE